MNISFDQWREWVGQLEVLKTYYQRLTERERYIVLGAGAAGLIFLLVLTYSVFLASTAGLQSKIEESRAYLAQLDELESVYLKTERQIRELEQTIRRSDPSFQLATELEKLARKHGIAMESIKERPGPLNELYRETQVTVAVKQVLIQTLVNFLFDVENSRQLLRITSVQIKPMFQDPTKLNVNFVVSTFQPNSGT